MGAGSRTRGSFGGSGSLACGSVLWGGDTGGAMTYLLPLVAALRREGVDACLICLGGGGLAEAAEERGLPVEVLPMAHRWDPRVTGGVNRAFSGARWDVIHAHGMRANLPLRLVRLVRGIRNYGRPGNRPCLFSTVHS